MQEPLVSVHMITYNHASYIRQAIECVLAQKTNFPFELVIGEDCSTDGTRDIVFDYQKKYPDIVRVIATENNVGMKKNGYRTFLACRGKYIAYCEGDDFWHREDKLQIQCDYLEAHPECGLVFSDSDRVYEAKTDKIKSFYKTTKNLPTPGFNLFKGWGNRRTYCNILTCTVMTHRDLLGRLLSQPYPYQDEHYRGGTDVVFIEIAFISKIHYIDESLSTYRVRVESACRSGDPVFLLRFNKAVLECFIYIATKYKDVQSLVFLRKDQLRCDTRLAFWSNDVKLADEARRSDTPFTIKDWIFYFGTKYRILHLSLYSIAKMYRDYHIRRRM